MSDQGSLGSPSITFTNSWFDITAKQIWDTIIPQINPKAILEIGSYEGASTCYFITNCASQMPIEIHCVDTWQGGTEHAGTDMTNVERRFLDNTKIARAQAPCQVDLIVHKGYSNVCLIKLLSGSYQNYFDLIYIDGSHYAHDVLSDAVLSFYLLKVGGVMIFDDYLWGSTSRQASDPLSFPKPAIDVFLHIYFHKMRLIASPNSQVCAKKISA